MISEKAFWFGILALCLNQWILGLALEKEFIKRVDYILGAINRKNR